MAVLLVDDDRDLVDVLTYILRREGYEIAAAFDGEQGWARFQADSPELVILDANMPGLDGFEVCKRIREVSKVPVIMLTARTDESDVVQALGFGADDYITKPFSPRQLVARVKAVLRRAQQFSPGSAGAGEELRAGDLVLDLRTRTLKRGEEEIRLTPLEYKILHYLMVNRGRVLTNSAIVEHVWGFPGAGNEDLVKVHVHRLRQKLEPDPQNPGYVRTVPGVGYMLRDER
ncbi:MAG TPA: response regulator transcription factor [Chloroflexota bacterium]|nr:response regulator transcription factor [Chloroflexota bacterium]